MFFLRKDWREPEDGADMVVLHWTTTRHGQPPTWRRAHATTVMNPQPGTSPPVRSCLLWIIPPFPRTRPRTRPLAVNAESEARFLVHSFCEVVQHGRVWTTKVTVQEMRAETVTYSDTAGEFTHAVLYYSLEGFSPGNSAPMSVEGLPSRHQRSLVLPEHETDNKEYRQRTKRARLIAELPRPHIFRGQLWGPVGARAFYSIYMSQRWTYNPFTENGMWLLQDGRPWEVIIGKE